MKTHKFAITLAAAAMMPAIALAGTDEIAASFERDLQRNLDKEQLVTIVSAWSDPLDIINQTLSREPDAIMASFERSIYRQPANIATVVARQADPLDVINETVSRVEYNPIMASFQLGLYREGVRAAVLPIRYDDPLHAINVALWQEMGNRRTVHMVSATY